jgi:hypothetical protein
VQLRATTKPIWLALHTGGRLWYNWVESNRHLDGKEHRRRAIKINYHSHLLARMEQRGITLEEVELTLSMGSDALDAKPGTQGKVRVFDYQTEWLGRFFDEKEVTVYYKVSGENLIVLTALARYGSGFSRRQE